MRTIHSHEASRDEQPSTLQSVAALALLVVVVFGVAAVGATFAPGEWYRSLEKPAFNPPSWVFAPVWTALYVTMALAAWLVWRRAPLRRLFWPGSAFTLQLALNGLWSFLFFGLHRPWLAFAEIVLLWLAIGATILLFARVRRLAAALLVPYLLWVSFAAVLNFALASLNP